jgi:hypothetical protein
MVVMRRGEHWFADVPEREGAHTYTCMLSALGQAVREVVGLAAGLSTRLWLARRWSMTPDG